MNPFKKIEKELLKIALTNKKGSAPFKNREVANFIIKLEWLLFMPFIVTIILRKFIYVECFLNSNWFIMLSMLPIFLILLPSKKIIYIAHSWSKENIAIKELKNQKIALFLRSFEKDYFEEGWEVIIFDFFESVGLKAVALGNPSDIFEPNGKCNRVYLEKKIDWKEQILDLITTASFIVVRIDNSPSLNWELEKVSSIFPPDQIMLYLPPHKKNDSMKDEYEIFRSSAERYFKKGLPAFQKNYRSLIISFDKQWRPRFLKVPIPVILISFFCKNTFSSLGDELILHSQMRQLNLKEPISSKITYWFCVIVQIFNGLFWFFIFIFIVWLLVF